MMKILIKKAFYFAANRILKMGVHPVEDYLEHHNLHHHYKREYYKAKHALESKQKYIFESHTGYEGFYFNKFALLSPREMFKKSDSAWYGHAFFAAFLISVLKPKTTVELGIHKGGSYFWMCEILKKVQVNGKIYGVDTFHGDEHANYINQNLDQNTLLQLVLQKNRPYENFSHILTKTFDEALNDFSEGQIDLLHIDGQHRYEDVSHDFNTWKNKLSSSSVVLFHDIFVQSRDFGVYEFWNEVKTKYPFIEFYHSSGLGVLFTGNSYNPAISDLINQLQRTHSNQQVIRNYYQNLFFAEILGNDLVLRQHDIYYQILKQREQNKKIFVFLSNDFSSLGQLRIKLPYEYCSNGLYNFHQLSIDMFNIDMIEFIDTFIIHRQIYETHLSIVKEISKAGKKIIFDLDDDILGTFPPFLAHQKIDIETKTNTENAIKLADLVTVASPPLKKKIQHLNSNTHVIENFIDEKLIQPAPLKQTSSFNLLISSSDSVTMQEIISPLSTLLKKHRHLFKSLIVIGPPSKELEPLFQDDIQIYPNMNYQTYMEFLSSLEPTIGLIPLDNSDFSSCKSFVKFISYSSNNIPAVCSNVIPYSSIINSGENGYLCKNDDEWVENVLQLTNIDLRNKLLENAKKFIRENFTYQNFQKKLKPLIDAK